MNDPKIKRNYIIFSDFFEYNVELMNSESIDRLNEYYSPWFMRNTVEATTEFFNKYIKDYYYSSFSNIAFPETKIDLNNFIRSDAEWNTSKKMLSTFCKSLNENEALLKHLTLKKKYIVNNLSVRCRDVSIKFLIDYIDLYLFSGGIGVFSIKTTISESPEISFNQLSDFVNNFRSPESSIYIDGDDEIIIKEFINKNVLKNPEANEFWLTGTKQSFSNKLKSFMIIEADLDTNEPEGKRLENHLLFETGTVSPIGSCRGKFESLAPSQSYFDEIIKNNKISVFGNWSGLSLFDSFIILLNKPQYRMSIFEMSELYYFSIYVHTLYLKLSLYKINADICEDNMLSKKNKKKKRYFH